MLVSSFKRVGQWSASTVAESSWHYGSLGGVTPTDRHWLLLQNWNYYDIEARAPADVCKLFARGHVSTVSGYSSHRGGDRCYS